MIHAWQAQIAFSICFVTFAAAMVCERRVPAGFVRGWMIVTEIGALLGMALFACLWTSP